MGGLIVAVNLLIGVNMSFRSFFGNLLTGIGALVIQAFKAAHVRGLTDDVVKLALQWARIAASEGLENDAARVFVLRILIKEGIPEGIARLSLELAIQLLKAELAKVG